LTYRPQLRAIEERERSSELKRDFTAERRQALGLAFSKSTPKGLSCHGRPRPTTTHSTQTSPQAFGLRTTVRSALKCCPSLTRRHYLPSLPLLRPAI
jgi:hypothetical protein